MAPSRAGVTQLAECQLPKLNVAGSNPVSRSTFPLSDERSLARSSRPSPRPPAVHDCRQAKRTALGHRERGPPSYVHRRVAMVRQEPISLLASPPIGRPNDPVPRQFTRRVHGLLRREGPPRDKPCLRGVACSATKPLSRREGGYGAGIQRRRNCYWQNWTVNAGLRPRVRTLPTLSMARTPNWIT
jgi:hypothetical protein